MFAIDDLTAVAVMPTPEAAGTPGFWTEGNPGGGQPATRMRASFFNGLQQELLNVLGAAAMTPNKTAYDQLLTAILKIAGGSSRVRGLVGANNSGTPATQFDFTCGAVDMRNPTTGAVYSMTSPASKTCNILTVGPAANGRDQAGAFSASSWVHFYYIFNPTTGAIDTISSASASAPAALPTGYTAWAYIGALYLSAGSALAQGSFRGSWFNYTNPPAALTSGGATTLTPVSITTLIPPTALQFEIYSSNLALTSNGSGGYGLTCNITAGAGGQFQFGLQGVGVAGTVFGAAGTAKRLNNIAQTFSYQLTLGSGAGAIVSISVNGYSVPNGGE